MGLGPMLSGLVVLAVLPRVLVPIVWVLVVLAVSQRVLGPIVWGPVVSVPMYHTLFAVVLLDGLKSQLLRCQETVRCLVFKLLFQTAVYKFEGWSLKLSQEQASPLSQEKKILSFCYLK